MLQIVISVVVVIQLQEVPLFLQERSPRIFGQSERCKCVNIYPSLGIAAYETPLKSRRSQQKAGLPT